MQAYEYDIVNFKALRHCKCFHAAPKFYKKKLDSIFRCALPICYYHFRMTLRPSGGPW